MPDAFFANPKKRKYSDSFKASSSKQSFQVGLKKSKLSNASTSQTKRRRKDEELSSGGSDGGNGHEMIDDEDLRADEVDPGLSGDEDADETAAEKRLRLAKIYLDGVKTALGAFSLVLWVDMRIGC
jgi:ribosomal RNA-processing protein 9